MKQSAVEPGTFVSANLMEQGVMAAEHFVLGDFTLFVLCRFLLVVLVWIS